MTTPRVLLALHTSDPTGSVAIAQGAQVVSHEFVAAGPRAPVVLHEILRGLEAAGVGLEACEAVAVTNGPGSFTGIRIGLATVQGLAAARTWPVYVGESHAAHAAIWHGLEELLAVVFDARRGEVYAALYDVREARPRVRVEPFCATPAAALARLVAAAAGAGLGIAVCGSGAGLVTAAAPAAPLRLLGAPAVTVATGLVRLARAGGCRLLAPRDLEPNYLRKSDAELQREQFRAERA